MTEADKKIREMEASIKAIAEYVKQQTARLEEEISRSDSDGFNDEIGDLKRRIESFSDEKEFSRLQFKKIDKLEQTIDERIEKLEELTKSAHMDEKLKKTLQSTRADVDSMKRDLTSKLKYFGEKLDKIEDGELNEKLTLLEKGLAEVVKTSKVNLEPYKKELEALNQKMLEDVRSRIEAGEKTLGDIAAKLENFNSGGSDQLKGELQNSRTDLEKFKADMNSRLQILNKSINELADNELKEQVGHIDNKLNDLLILKSHMEDVEKDLNEAKSVAGKVKGFEKDIEEMKSVAGKLRGFDADSYKKEFERRMASALERLQGIEAEDIKNVSSMISELGIKAGDLKKLKSAVDSLQGVESEDVKKLSEMVHQLGGAEASDIKKLGALAEQLREMEVHDVSELAVKLKHLENLSEGEMRKLAQMADEFKDFEEKDIKSLSAKMKHIEKIEADDARKLAEAADQFRDIEAKDIKNLASKMRSFEKMEKGDVEKLNEMFEQFKDVEAKDLKDIASKLKHFEKMEESDLKKLNEMFEQFKDVEAKDLKDISRHVKEAKDIAEEEAVNRIAFEKRILDLENLVNKFKQLEHNDMKRLGEFMQQLKDSEIKDIKSLKETVEKHVNESLKQLKNIEAGDIKRLSDTLEHLQGVELEEMKDIAANIKEAKQALEDETVNRQSFEKRLNVTDAKLRKINDVVGHIENMEGLDIEKLSNRINDIESNMKLNTVKLLTQQLNEFAKTMDRRIPNIVSREEYIAQVADLNQRMRTIEAPDLSPLGARVERLEKKIEEVAGMMRQMYNRVPIVVE